MAGSLVHLLGLLPGWIVGMQAGLLPFLPCFLAAFSRCLAGFLVWLDRCLAAVPGFLGFLGCLVFWAGWQAGWLFGWAY